MAIRTCTRRATLVVLALTTTLALISAPGAAAKSKPVELRVVTSSGKTLADYEQYTGGGITAKADRRADCFGESNPSSNKRYPLRGASALSALIDAKSHERRLRPLRLTDAFVDDGFGFGVCRIGAFSTVGFAYWYTAIDYLAGSTGPDLIPLRRGDHLLWYLTNGSEPGFPGELELRAPARARMGDLVAVKVIRHLGDGSREPAAGVTVKGAAAPTDAQGETTVLAGGPLHLRARGLSDDVPSGRVGVCVAPKLSRCPAHRGKTIYGSKRRDRIEGGKGNDEIRAGKGSDRIDVRSGGADKVVCGAGHDLVIRAKHQRGLVLRGCEGLRRRSG